VDVREFLDIFLSESREHVEGMNALLQRARAHPLGAEEINDLFRHAHSLKGMAASMGFRPMADLAHAMEDQFQAWRDRGDPPAAGTLELLQRGSDRLAAQVDLVAAGGDPQPEDALTAALRAVPSRSPGARRGRRRAAGGRRADRPAARNAKPHDAAPAPPPRSEPAAPTAPGDDRLHLQVFLQKETPLPAARALVILKRLAEVGRVIEVSPAPEAISAGGFDGGLRVTLATKVAPERVRRFVLDLPDVADCDADAARENRRTSDRRSAERRVPAAAAEGEIAPQAEAGAVIGAARPEAIGTIRVATERMDRLLDGIGELILDRERLKRALDSRRGSPERAILENLGRTIDALRDEVVAMRMIPFASLVPRLQRMVRDLGRRLDKPVELAVQGVEVSLDRSILEEMMDPLEHILRNSIDHGIEDAAGRRAASKPSEGRIEIVLAPRDGRVHLSVEDDGRGIDPGALRRVAVDRRFLTREAAERLSDEEALMLITLPGFSTAARTTDISGRGVGMDVVLTQVRRLGGRLTVRSRVGAGTRFEMDLPPTVTVTRAFLCRAAGDVYAVPVSVVQNTLHVRREGLQESHGDRVIQRDDEVVTVLPLSGLLRGDPVAAFPAMFPALVYREGRRPYALAVDEILGEEEIVVKPLKHPLELLPQYAGAAILNDGQIALILDPANLARFSRAA